MQSIRTMVLLRILLIIEASYDQNLNKGGITGKASECTSSVRYLSTVTCVRRR